MKKINKVEEVKDLKNNFDYFLKLKTKIDKIVPNLFLYTYVDSYFCDFTSRAVFYYVKEIDSTFKNLYEALSTEDSKKYYEIKVYFYNLLLDFSIFVDRKNNELQFFLKHTKQIKVKKLLNNKQK